MNVVPTMVRLPAGFAERIDALMGPNKRAEFIREAVERELRRQEKKAADVSDVERSGGSRGR